MAERMTVKTLSASCVGVVQSLRAGVWKDVHICTETESTSFTATMKQTEALALELGCAFVHPSFIQQEAA